ncbi:MAG: thiamine phosphate synthase [Rhodospirillaceae bacterium]|nr:thiamine phosphate synthase [Rhodospirillaceae bacterium]
MTKTTNKESEKIRCRLYLLTPPAIPDLTSFARTLEETLAAGDVASVQLRLKGCDDGAIKGAVRALMPICHAKDVAFILNDRPDLAKQLGCDGVHVGPEDASYDEARSIVGPDAMVGVTCRDSRHVAMDLAEDGADYVAFGPFFASSTKDVSDREPVDPEILEIWSTTINVPCVAIGGITVENCEPLVAAGADFLAVTNGVWGYKDGPAAAVKAFNAIFDKAVA